MCVILGITHQFQIDVRPNSMHRSSKQPLKDPIVNTILLAQILGLVPIWEHLLLHPLRLRVVQGVLHIRREHLLICVVIVVVTWQQLDHLLLIHVACLVSWGLQVAFDVLQLVESLAACFQPLNVLGKHDQTFLNDVGGSCVTSQAILARITRVLSLTQRQVWWELSYWTAVVLGISAFFVLHTIIEGLIHFKAFVVWWRQDLLHLFKTSALTID